MGLMALNLATLNARGLSDPSKCARLLGELLNLSVDVAANYRALEDDYSMNDFIYCFCI